MESKSPKTLKEAIEHFADPERAFVAAVNLRWPDGKVICPRCSGENHSFIKTRLLWFCKGCKRQFTVKVGSIMEDSPIGLDKWMMAIWMTVNCKNGISSWELHRALGITQKSAWFLLSRIREALKGGGFGKQGKLGGGHAGSEIEVDESYIGGKARNMHKSRRIKYEQMGGHHGKAAVQGFLDRETRKIRAEVVPNVKRETLQALVLKNVRYGSSVYTDNAVAYDMLKYKFVHEVVNHANEYVRGRVHTNGLESFWSLLKRNIRGTYVAVEPFHLHRYLDEQVFRYNNRGSKDEPVNDSQRFAIAMSQLGGKRLTYSELTGKDIDSVYHPATETRPQA
jgi:transposase-like protein